MAVLERTYQASDLAGTGRREFLDQARVSYARLRDTDGLTLVMLPQKELDVLTELLHWTIAYLVLENALARSAAQRHSSDLGALAWAIVFDNDDLQEFCRELGDALVQAGSARDLNAIHVVLRDWRRTADMLSDPIARDIISGEFREEDFQEVTRPQEETDRE